MTTIDSDYAVVLAGSHEQAASALATLPSGVASLSTPPSLPLLVLANLQAPRRATIRSSETSAEVADHVGALFVRTEKSSRRQGFIGPRTPTTSAQEAPRPRGQSGELVAESLDVVTRAMLIGALKGTGKFRHMPEPEREHIFKMLEANDLPGLEAVANAGNPLRSFSTGLKVGKQLLERRSAENLPSALREPLMRLREFYEHNLPLIELGDARAFSPEHARSTGDVQQLRDAFAQAHTLLGEIERAMRT